MVETPKAVNINPLSHNDSIASNVQIPVLNVGGSSPFGRTNEKSPETLVFQRVSGLFYIVPSVFYFPPFEWKRQGRGDRQGGALQRSAPDQR